MSMVEESVQSQGGGGRGGAQSGKVLCVEPYQQQYCQPSANIYR